MSQRIGAIILFLSLAGSAAAMSARLSASPEAPAAVGTSVTWHTEASDLAAGTNWYRYRVRTPGATEFQTVRDYSPDTDFTWTPSQVEGTYEIEASIRHRESGEEISETVQYEVTSRVTGQTPVITPTANELVFLYSAPACASGSRMRVSFESAQGVRQFTPFQDCAEGSSMNFYLAGLRVETDYTAKHLVQTGEQVTEGPPVVFRTPLPTFEVAQTHSLQRPEGSVPEGVLLQSTIFQFPVATDMEGNLVWYYPGVISYLTRPLEGGYFFVLIENHEEDYSHQILRQIDLAGNVVLETNAARINEQLEAMGKHIITSFHHEARRLPEGKILVLAGTERILHDVQGPGPVDVIGDTILVLNRNLEVEWAWDGFDHLDPRRKALLDEKCMPGGGGCPTFYLAPEANDWLHGNSLQLTPDGHILYSSRHQDWVIKINYDRGAGNGDVIWRLGKDGDFQFLSEDAWPWFSHQHDANYERTGEGDHIVVFDNGNTRYTADNSAKSRGQVLKLDEINRTATLVLNVDLGEYSFALGSAQRLLNGNYHFDLGWMPNSASQALEFDPEGNLVSLLETGTQQYRSFRMQDMYTP